MTANIKALDKLTNLFTIFMKGINPKCADDVDNKRFESFVIYIIFLIIVRKKKQKEIAGLLNMTASNLSKYLYGTNPVTDDVINRFNNAFKNDLPFRVIAIEDLSNSYEENLSNSLAKENKVEYGLSPADKTILKRLDIIMESQQRQEAALARLEEDSPKQDPPQD